MPILRLRKHPANFSEEDILINPSDFSGLKLNDVVELKPPKGGSASNRILLQVRNWPDSVRYPNSVSIKDSVVNAHLKLYSDVLVNVIDKKDVLVDSIEIYFSNAYLARSYMWGLRNYLNNRCVYQHQKLDYLHIRSQICEIWAQGNKVTSGYVDDDTKIVFRSASSLVYLFIQMSSEMWDYDINGDLYCEKAINGFLTDLFDAWRQNECSHDITIVLFSRTFYDAESLEEFPKEMRECLQVDYKNRFYEDCYRVAFQNDRFDLHDWNAKLTTLKSLFNQYQREVIDRHQEKYDMKIPRAYNSSAAQGNFLEVLNMSLNVFEKHYFDRSFDRTGQLSVVVSPGVGVFEVDFEMTNLTKQRIIDNGIGSDLVCLGEQPLHTVPLLKFNSKAFSENESFATCDVYNMPHWINLSFYSSQNQVYYSNFVPRIKLPTIHNKLTYDASKSTALGCNNQHQTSLGGARTMHQQNSETSSAISDELNVNSKDRSAKSSQNFAGDNATNSSAINATCSGNSNNSNSNNNNNRHSGPHFTNHPTMPDLVDYDDYDSQVFKPNSTISYQQPSSRGERSALTDLDLNVDCLTDNDDYFLDRDNRNKSASVQRRSSDVKNYQEYSRNMKRQEMSENLPIAQSRVSPQIQTTFTRMSLVDSYLTDIKIKPESADDLSVRGYNVQSSRINRSSARPKALINPFDPSHMTIKLTPNRRRWTHVFPQGPTGTFMQQHHHQPVPSKSALPYLADVLPPAPILENEPLQLRLTTGPPVQHSSNPAGRVAPIAPTTRLHINTKPTGLDSSNQQQLLLARKWNDSLSLLSPTLSHSTIVNPAGSGSLNTTTGSYNKSTLVSNDTIRFAWCASGEQEWTPAITTGVDWKSLTMPACLPLTTDFFPSKTSLQNDYVIGEYTIDSSCIHSRYTLIDVYRELVCQRLQKGFQIILLPRQPNSHSEHHNHHSSLPSASIHKSRSATSSSASSSSKHHRTSRSSATSSSTAISTDIAYDGDRERTEYTMSIGRIFHKLSLNGNTITVTQYKPRHPYPTIKIDYCYRFRAPFHENYGQSWVHFKSEKLENYNWNYLDNYICARGESFELRSSLKFWRFRVLILPSRPSLRRISHDTELSDTIDQQHERHDVHYLNYSNEEAAALMDSFMKLLEIINKTRRASACRLSSSSQYSINSAAPLLSSAAPVNSSANNHGQSTGRQNQQVAPASPSRLDVQINNNALRGQQAGAEDELELRKLQFESINMDIDSALRDAKRAEFVHVQYHSFYDIRQAFELVIKWMVASGAGIAEMVQGWSRKAGNSSVHLVPIPWEPFALPHSGKADPLRCPIGIQLHLDCLPEGNSIEDARVICLQEKILRRFGFVRFHDLISSENIERQFVHMSGFAFVALPNLISITGESAPSGQLVDTSNSQREPTLLTRSPSKSSSASSPKMLTDAAAGSRIKPALPSLKLEHQETISSPHEEYITRHISGARQDKTSRLRGENGQVEFIWSWNYMLTKRWRSPSTQDESYAVSLMQDFKDFCSNDQNRLIQFWKEIREKL